jgi:FMN phosphatase YigB (HAD superfamily)
MTRRRIEFVYFDLGNVLLAFDHGLASRQIAKLVGATEGAVDQAIFQSGLQDRYERGEIACDEFHSCCVEQIGECQRDPLLHALSDIFRPIDSVWLLVARLRAADVRIGVLSNTCRAHWRFVTDRFKVPSQFEVLALSYEIGCMKPNSRIYRQAAVLANVPAEAILFIDDRMENVAAAADAGFDAVQFRDPEALESQLYERRLLRS